MCILSFDPASLANLGWAFLVLPDNKQDQCSFDAGTFVFSENSQHLILHGIYTIADELINYIKPDIVVIEKTSSFSGGFVTGQVSACIGVLLAVCGKYRIHIVEVFPTHVKKVVTGSGKAKKHLIRKSVQDYLKNNFNCDNVELNSQHSYDAMANIICYLIEYCKINKKDQKKE